MTFLVLKFALFFTWKTHYSTYKPLTSPPHWHKKQSDPSLDPFAHFLFLNNRSLKLKDFNRKFSYSKEDQDVTKRKDIKALRGSWIWYSIELKWPLWDHSQVPLQIFISTLSIRALNRFWIKSKRFREWFLENNYLRAPIKLKHHYKPRFCLRSLSLTFLVIPENTRRRVYFVILAPLSNFII